MALLESPESIEIPEQWDVCEISNIPNDSVSEFIKLRTYAGGALLTLTGQKRERIEGPDGGIMVTPPQIAFKRSYNGAYADPEFRTQLERLLKKPENENVEVLFT